MGFNGKKKVMEPQASSLDSLMSSRPQFETEFENAQQEINSYLSECNEARALVQEWSDRVKLVEMRLDSDRQNTTFQVLHEQAVINKQMEQEKLDALLAHKEEFDRKREAITEGLKTFDRLELVIATANRASDHNTGVQTIFRSLAQASLDAGIDIRKIRHAEHVAQARTELSLGIEPLRELNV